MNTEYCVGRRQAEREVTEDGWVQLPGSELWARDDDVMGPRSLEDALWWTLERRGEYVGLKMSVTILKTYRLPGVKPGRNELCPCGSGVKHKRCCLMMLRESRKVKR